MGHHGSAPSTQGVPPYCHRCWLDGTGHSLFLLASKLPPSLIITAFNVCTRKMDSSVVLLLAAWHRTLSSLCPKSTCLFDLLQRCKNVIQLSKVYKVLHATHSMRQIRTHVQPACGAAFVGVSGIKKDVQLIWFWRQSAPCQCVSLCATKPVLDAMFACTLWCRKPRAVMRTLTGQSREPCKGLLQLRQPLQLLW